MSVELLKLLAMVTMLLDHLGAVGFFGESSLLMRYVGRISFPIFAYLMATGFRFTKNKEKQILYLGIFAVLSEIPFDLVHGAFYYPQSQNVLWTFFFATLTMYAIQKAKNFMGGVFALCTGLISFSAVYFLQTDYSIYGFSLVVCIFVFEQSVRLEKSREEILKKVEAPCWMKEKDYLESCGILLLNIFVILIFINYSMISLPVTFLGLTFSAQLFGVFSFFPIAVYIISGQRKKLSGKPAIMFKWFHFCFYPAHLLLLSFLI